MFFLTASWKSLLSFFWNLCLSWQFVQFVLTVCFFVLLDLCHSLFILIFNNFFKFTPLLWFSVNEVQDFKVLPDVLLQNGGYMHKIISWKLITGSFLLLLWLNLELVHGLKFHSQLLSNNILHFFSIYSDNVYVHRHIL